MTYLQQRISGSTFVANQINTPYSYDASLGYPVYPYPDPAYNVGVRFGGFGRGGFGFGFRR